MNDPLFSGNDGNSQIIDRLRRCEGSIPYLRRATQVFSASSVQAPTSQGVSSVSSGNAISGTIIPTSGVQNVGNAFPFYVKGRFGFTASDTSITIYWDGTNGSQPFVIKRVDGTSFSVPKGTLTINGLSADTLYGFQAYNCLTNQQNLSFCTGDAGTPRFAFSPSASDELKAKASQNLNLSVNEAVTEAFIYYATAAAGTTAGQGLPGTISPYSQVRFPPSVFS